ncbi:hypothetical protein Dimus_018032, partial [Dionaea muscipula]
ERGVPYNMIDDRQFSDKKAVIDRASCELKERYGTFALSAHRLAFGLVVDHGRVGPQTRSRGRLSASESRKLRELQGPINDVMK